MKSAQFKRNPSVIRMRREEPSGKKRPIGKIIYLAIFWGLLAWVAYFFLSKALIMDRAGQVRFKKIDVQTLTEGRIEQIFVREGDLVNEGDLLFTFRTETEPPRSRATGPEWLERELWEAERDLTNAEPELERIRKKLASLEAAAESEKRDVLLELKSSGRLDRIEEEREALALDLEMKRRERGLLRERVADIRTRIANQPVELPPNPIREVKAPGLGTVTYIGKTGQEVIFPSETVIQIHRQDEVLIRAFFDQGDMKHLNVGDRVLIILPGRRKTEGRIERFNFTTFPLPEEFQPRFEPTKRSIAVDIVPDYTGRIDRDQFFYKMGVRIRKPKWDFLWLWL